MQAVPEVTECDLTTGESDYVLRVVARDAADFERLHSKVLTKLPGVARVDSSFVLRSVVKNAGPADRGLAPAPDQWPDSMAAPTADSNK